MRTSSSRRLSSRFGVPLAVIVGSMGAVLSYTGDADACGGCFHPPSANTVVTGHRMVLAVSTTQTVLWDQIQYQGDPSEFAWVLPIKPGARVEAGTAAFFEMLEAYTARNITAPSETCGRGLKPIGCGLTMADSGAGGGFATPKDGVNVIHDGTVGPYETVTLQTSTPGALNKWLTAHNYNVDASSQPIIDAYVAEGFDFIALRLQPGQGVQAMTPVRVVSPGASPTLPLRMVAIGTGATVPIILHVIGEGRWAVENFPEAKLNTSLLSWDFADNTSNYASLRSEALKENGGQSWLTAFARSAFFTNTNVYDPSSGGNVPSFASSYMNQALQDKEIATACALPQGTLSGRVTNPCPPGEPWDSPKCGQVPLGDIDARKLGCPGADDLAVALTGMKFEDVWDTRLEAELPRAALAVDLDLQAAAHQAAVSNNLTADIAVNTDKVCGTTVILPNVKPPAGKSSLPSFFAVMLAAMGLGLAARRVRSAEARR